jgi:hypothetical protein
MKTWCSLARITYKRTVILERYSNRIVGHGLFSEYPRRNLHDHRVIVDLVTPGGRGSERNWYGAEV